METAAGAAEGPLTVEWLEVGQGSVALYRAPCGDIALIDAGTGSDDDVLDQLDVTGWGLPGRVAVPFEVSSDLA